MRVLSVAACGSAVDDDPGVKLVKEMAGREILLGLPLLRNSFG